MCVCVCRVVIIVHVCGEWVLYVNIYIATGLCQWAFAIFGCPSRFRARAFNFSFTRRKTNFPENKNIQTGTMMLAWRILVVGPRVSGRFGGWGPPAILRIREEG